MASVSSIWRGNVYIDAGVALFRGSVGDNAQHRHGAHQLSVGLADTIALTSETGTSCASGFFIPAGCGHRLLGHDVASIYADPTSALGRSLYAEFGEGTGATTISASRARELANLIGRHRAPAEAIELLQGTLSAKSVAQSERLGPVVQAIAMGLTGRPPSRAELAAMAHLSEGRFSHWFREQTGVPMQTYRMWLRLTYTVEEVLRGQSMADAAIDNGFADQAHFVRSFRQLFGINPVAALAQLHKE